MTLPAWRPLKDAPAEGTILVKLADGQLKLATATVVTVGFCRHGGDPGWQEAAWVDDGDRQIPDDSIVGWLPIADTYELDRAVQGEIARAFGALIQAMVDAEHYLSIRGPNSSYDLIYEDAANTYRAAGLRTFARTIHTSMGGRIPDEVP